MKSGLLMKVENKKLIVVLGVHRSGTSAITRGLQVMGVELGERLMPPMEGVNPKGFWEDIDINALNIEMLTTIGSDWYHLAPLEKSQVERLNNQGYHLRALELLRQKTIATTIFGFKDPRLAKLLPFWKEVFGHCQFEVNYVLALRHPRSVLKSLAKRDGIEAEQGYLLWLGHVIESLNGSEGCRRVLVDYDRLMQSPEAELKRVSKCFCLEIDFAELQSYKTQFLDQDLRHTVYEQNDLLLDDACPPLVREVYAALLDVALDKKTFDEKVLQSNLVRWTDEFERFKSSLLLADRLYTQKMTAKYEISERESQIASLGQAVADRESQIASLGQAVSELNAYVRSLVGSRSWSITKPIRWIGRVIRGDFVAAMGPVKNVLSRSRLVKLSSLPCFEEGLVEACDGHIIPSPIKPTHPVAVILPVYRGVEMTKRCILAAMPGVLAIPDARIIAINDASPDEGMQNMLEQLAIRWPNVFVVLKNENNLGFVATVNRGLAYFSQHDAVLLNSDVIVPQDWLGRLTEEAYSRENVGTVTPFTNNATICSFPYFLQENKKPFDLDVDLIDAVFRHEKLACIEAPTGVGFCMYIRRSCLNIIGYLNEEKFGRGYGEENDLCQRALKSGWLNLISPNMYAFHEGGVSFSSDKHALVDRAMQVLDELHPNYHSDVQMFIKTDPVKAARVTRYAKLLGSTNIPKVLHISHSVGGGVKQHIDELSEYCEQRIASILMTPHGANGELSVSLGVNKYADSLIFNLNTGYADMVEFFKAIGISAIHYHHTYGLDSRIFQLPADIEATYLLTAHDFYWLCGNPTLTDDLGRYLGFYSDQQRNPLYPLPQGMTVRTWQNSLRIFIDGADCMIFPSNSTRFIFENVYHPKISVVAPHVEPYLNINETPVDFKKKSSYNIGVLGALGREKGADLLEGIAIKSKGENLSFSFKLIGYAYRPLRFVEMTGPYENRDLKELIRKHELDIILFTAQWPETYSYTLSYAMDSGLPIVAPNTGAFPERLSGRKNTLLFNHLGSVSELLNNLVTFVEHISRKEAIKAPIFENNNSKYDFYSNDYVGIVSRNLKLAGINESFKFDADNFRIISGMQHKNVRLGNIIVHILWRLHMSPNFRQLSLLIPHRVRRAIKRLLSSNNSHDIARGAKGK